MAARITEDVLNERLDIIKKTKNIVLVGELQPDKTRSIFKCLTCSYEFKSTVWHMYKGPQGCGRCSGKVITPQDVNDRLKSLQDRSILFDDVYTKIHAKYNFKCLKCDYTWITTLAHVHGSKTGCGRCNKVRLSNQDIEDRISEIKSRGIELLETFKGMHKKHQFRCNTHGIVWVTDFSNINGGKGCKECGRKKISERLSLSKEKLDAKLIKFNKKGIYLNSVYTKFSDVHNFRCDKHEETFEFSLPFESLKGCPKCAGLIKTPKEIEDTKALNIIRSHLHSQYKKGRIDSRSSKLSLVSKLETYWYEQWTNIPDKPGKDYSLDHILPISIFDPNDLVQMFDCWSYKNLQWITDTENSAKSNKLMPQYFTSWHYEILNNMGIKIPV